MTEAVELLKSLSVQEVERRLSELEGERAALRTILRSLRARERERSGSTNRPTFEKSEAAHAS